MFEWNVDEFRLMNDADAIETEDGKIFSIESVLSRDEKKDYLNKKYDGLIDYVYELEGKYKKDESLLPKDKYGFIKTVSAQAWKKRNDSRKVLYEKGFSMTLNSEKFPITASRQLANLNLKGNFDLHEDFVDNCFNKELSMLEKQEKEEHVKGKNEVE